MVTKERIIKMYKNLVIQKQSTKIAVKEICANLEISRTTFYKYFKDSYDVLECIFVNDAISQMEVLYQSKLDKKTIIEGWYISFYKNKEFYQYAMRDESQNSLFHTVIARLTEFNREVYKKYIPAEDVEYYSYKYATMQAMLLKKWMQEGMVVEPSRMAEYFLNDFLSGHE